MGKSGLHPNSSASLSRLVAAGEREELGAVSEDLDDLATHNMELADLARADRRKMKETTASLMAKIVVFFLHLLFVSSR